MAPTRKVARGGSLQKKAVSKKSASLSGVKSVKVAKKTTSSKKSTSKVVPVKITAPPSKKRIPQKPAQTIKVTSPGKKLNTKTITSKKTPETSVQNNTIQQKSVHKLVSTDSEKGVSKKQKGSKEVKTTQRKPTFFNTAVASTGLAIFSATRFPVGLDTFAIQTARVGGVLVVVMGAFFTLLYSQYIWNAPVIAESFSGAHMMGNVVGCDAINKTPETYTKCSVEKLSAVSVAEHEPPLTFEVKSSEPLTGTVPIYIRVENARTVDVLLFKGAYYEPVPLGPATKVSQGVWLYQWDTTIDEDDFYKVAADVTNAYTIGSPYRDSDGKYLEVINDVSELSTPVSTVSPGVIDTRPTVTLSVDAGSVVKGEAKFTIQTNDAQKVTLVAQHTNSGSKNTLGDANRTSDGTWVYRWDTDKYVNGAYRITTKIRNEYGSYSDGEIELTVTNVRADDDLEDVVESVEADPLDDIAVDDIIKDVDTVMEAPEAVLRVMQSGILAGFVDLQVTIDAASFVEIWVIPEGSKTRKIIGLAKQVTADSDQWILRWDTKRMPNASYRVIARVKNTFGLYESNTENMAVYNVPYTPKLTEVQNQETEQIVQAEKIEQELRKEAVKVAPESAVTAESEDAESELTSLKEDRVTALLNAFTEEITTELQRFIVAYRSKDPDTIQRAEYRLDQLRQEIIASSLRDTRSNDLAAELDERITEITTEYKALSKRAEVLISQRVGTDVFEDSDSDGISNYDELTLYKTDPFTADSDGDGFIDGLEVAEGYDPLDSVREVAVVYQSPKEQGVVREDILQVTSIESIVPEDPKDDTDGVAAQAVISGIALPNSFVTLYIFSTPIVVTVKTEEDGSWKYRFDKELEDGEHTVYIGLTDNAGRIVAKSEPFRFVKEAQAFTPADAAGIGSITTESVDDSLLSSYMIYLILSISVVSIGLVLILLGLHLDTRQRRFSDVVTSKKES